jgi:hypothetical protein
MIWGFLRSSAASVTWNSDKLRIIAEADIIAIFAVLSCVEVQNLSS